MFFFFRDLTKMRFSNASFPTKKDDILVLLSRSLFHVRIERDPFAGFFDELSLSAPKPNLKSYHDTLSSYLGPVFEIGDLVGSGGYGQVFKATRTINGQPTVMALKVFDHRLSESDVRAEFAILQILQKLYEIA